MEILGKNSTLIAEECPVVEGVLFQVLNCYSVTTGALLSNLVTAAVGVSIIVLYAIVISAVWRNSYMEDATDILIASLALADALIGVFLIYHTAYNMVNWQLLGECLFRLGFFFACNLSSLFGMVLLTTDRYVKITRPYLYQRLFNKTMIVSLTVALWVLSLLLGLLPVMGWNSPPEILDERTVCFFFSVLGPGYRLLLVILLFIPFLINSILYGHIFKIAHKHARLIFVQKKSLSSSIAEPSRPSKRTWKFTKTIALVMGFYCVCWFPTDKVRIVFNVATI